MRWDTYAEALNEQTPKTKDQPGPSRYVFKHKGSEDYRKWNKEESTKQGYS